MNGKSEQIPTRILHVAVPKSNLKSEFQESSIRVTKKKRINGVKCYVRKFTLNIQNDEC